MTSARTIGMLLALVATTAISSGPAAGSGGGHQLDGARLVVAVRQQTVLGYLESGDGSAPLDRNASALSVVGVDGVNIARSGRTVPRPDGQARALLAQAHRRRRSAELLVGNFDQGIGDFSPGVAHRLLSSRLNRHTVIASLVADARRGWDGIELDFESLHGSDAGGLSRFAAELRAALPHRTVLSMAVMASSSVAGYRRLGYDLPQLAVSMTRMVLMAYDQHGPTWTAAGPVGGLPWATRAMKAMLRAVPRRKVILGVAGYGYTWPTRGTGTQLSDAGSRRVATSATWNATQAEWTARLRGGGTIWWSDAKSLKVRRALAGRLGIGGVATWSLGLSDPIAKP